jgi:hypothetical protein
VEQKSGELDVCVAQPVNDANSMPLKDFSSLGCGLVSDQKQGHLRVSVGILDELPGRRSIGAALGFHGDRGAGSREVQDGVYPTVGAPGLLIDDGHPRDLAQNAQGVRLELASIDLHNRGLIHNNYEYSGPVKFPGRCGRPSRPAARWALTRFAQGSSLPRRSSGLRLLPQSSIGLCERR